MNEILLRNIVGNQLTVRQLTEMTAWCEEKFGPSKCDRQWRWVGGRWWLDGTYSFKFTHSEDAMLFTLRWA